ncbi:DUF4304 domain-containing protein [Campylobacter curvus]|uniref:DUF4304 domain-containing protein n=1 Tax=Campylobacter curvus TaxID=200 RepID=UPI00037298CC|nr:DUF4304 domain-containing protein [Campylobacter curvus]QKF60875.1 DUF4304 domain-containing protein [Campylobacter curvus]UEB49196.1 DUF4304 domain-containing protein [Campylobacter curvus]
MKEIFETLIKQTAKPLLKENGFTKKGLNFFKKQNELIFTINFQKSSTNSPFETKFYINCGVYASIFDTTLGKNARLYPKEYECHFRERISAILKEKDGYFIDQNTDVSELGKKLTQDLNLAIKFFDEIKNADDLVKILLAKGGLNLIDTIFEYLLATKNEKNFIEQSWKLHAKYGNEARWQIFENKINKMLEKYGLEKVNFNEMVKRSD